MKHFTVKSHKQDKINGRRKKRLDIQEERRYNLNYFMRLPYGVERREKILECIDARVDVNLTGIPVNRRYCPIIKRDRDIQYLLKKNKVKLVRKSIGSWSTNYYRLTYIVRA